MEPIFTPDERRNLQTKESLLIRARNWMGLFAFWKQKKDTFMHRTAYARGAA